MPARSLLASHIHDLKLNDPQTDYKALLDAIGDCKVVCIGDGSHGTEEFYRERAYITQLLIKEKGFNIVATESDWPDSYVINRYVLGDNEAAKSPVEALRDFKRFPLWMWRNDVMVPFVNWLRKYNDSQTENVNKVGYYGMDVYSLTSSMEAVIQYLEKVDPKAADKARSRYGCFDRFGDDPQTYAFTTRYGLAQGCANEALRVLTDLLKNSQSYAKSPRQEEAQFVAEQNAYVARNAEEYYRCMLDEDVKTWNLRDTHMVNTLERLVQFRTKIDGLAKCVVWAHNSHVGDARYTDMGSRRGEVNVGQLCREKFGPYNVFNIGFTTYTGTVTAADKWDSPAKLMKVKNARDDSWESVLTQECGKKNVMVITHRKDSDGIKRPVDSELSRFLNHPERLERFIGVIYKPLTERWSHYSHAQLSNQFDTICHIYESHGIQPLDKSRDFPTATEDVDQKFPAHV